MGCCHTQTQSVRSKHRQQSRTSHELKYESTSTDTGRSADKDKVKGDKEAAYIEPAEPVNAYRRRGSHQVLRPPPLVIPNSLRKSTKL
jgi:hypothetical protein